MLPSTFRFIVQKKNCLTHHLKFSHCFSEVPAGHEAGLAEVVHVERGPCIHTPTPWRAFGVVVDKRKMMDVVVIIMLMEGW